MSWALIAANQWVSWANLQDAIDQGNLPSTGTAIVSPTSLQWVNKPNVTTYVNINTANTFYSAKATNQWVAKQDLVSNLTTANSFTFYAASSQGCISIDSDVLIDEFITIKASELKIGDYVYTKASIEDKFSYCKVLSVVSSKKDGIKITTKNFVLDVSTTQPLFSNGKWVNSGDLIVGNDIYTESGYEEILSIHSLGVIDVIIYSIEFAKTFFANGIFCHNKFSGPLAGYSTAALACAHSTPAGPFTGFYTGTFGNGTIIYSNSTGGGFQSAFLWGTGTGNVYYNITTSSSFTVTYNTVQQTYTVANYTTCTPVMTIKVINNNSVAKTGFIGSINGNNFLTGVIISGSGGSASGTTTYEVVGSNTITLTGGTSNKTIASSGAIIDAVTSSAVSYTISSGNGTPSLVLSVTLTSANETNGIIITIT